MFLAVGVACNKKVHNFQKDSCNIGQTLKKHTHTHTHSNTPTLTAQREKDDQTEGKKRRRSEQRRDN